MLALLGGEATMTDVDLTPAEREMRERHKRLQSLCRERNRVSLAQLECMVNDAAALIDALQAAREALRPFAEEADRYEPDEGDGDHPAWDTTVTIGDLRRARAALPCSAEATQGSPQAERGARVDLTEGQDRPSLP